MNNTLYGDGIHDDYPAIQEMLDQNGSLIALPSPVGHYLISKTLTVHSRQTLRLPPQAVIRLTPRANCSMLENAWADDPVQGNTDISVVGGIWDMAHASQSPNPYHFPDPVSGRSAKDFCQETGYEASSGKPAPFYTGMCFRFYHLQRFTFSDVTIVNPVTYGVQLSYTEDFTIENIRFVFNEGSPKLWNMDGIHIEGGCRNGVIRDLKGACHDDLVALTSDDGIWGPVENIVIDGIFAEHCHSAVRLLSQSLPVRNIHISNIFGSYYVYCIMISKYYNTNKRSGFENLAIDHVYASICEGTADVPGNYEPLIAVGRGMDIRRLTISHVYRNENRCPLPAVGIGEDTHIGRLSISDSEQTADIPGAIDFLRNSGTIDRLYLRNVSNMCGETMTGPGVIGQLYEQ